MKRIPYITGLHFIVFVILSTISVSEELLEQYELNSVIELSYGKEKNPLGYRDTSSHFSNLHDGPISFAVCPITNNLCIVDFVNQCLKVFEKDGKLKAIIDIEGYFDMTGCEVIYDENGTLWVHHSYEQYVNRYSPSGRLLRTIYFETRGKIFGYLYAVSDSNLMIGPFSVIIKSSLPSTNSYMADAEFTPESKYGMNTGKITGRHYEIIGANISDSGELIPKSLEVKLNGIIKHEIKFPELPSRYRTYFRKENLEGNSYFEHFSPYTEIMDKSVWKYDTNMNLIGKIVIEPSKTKHRMRALKDISIMPDGSIFYLLVTHENVKVYKWIAKKY